MRFWILRVFLVLWTVCIGAYVSMMLLMSPESLTRAHERIPPLGVVSTFFQFRDAPVRDRSGSETQQKVREAISSIRSSVSFNAKSVDPLVFDTEDKQIDVYTPYFMFEGTVGTGLASFVVTHEQENSPVTENLLTRVDENNTREREV